MGNLISLLCIDNELTLKHLRDGGACNSSDKISFHALGLPGIRIRIEIESMRARVNKGSSTAARQLSPNKK